MFGGWINNMFQFDGMIYIYAWKLKK